MAFPCSPFFVFGEDGPSRSLFAAGWTFPIAVQGMSGIERTPGDYPGMQVGQPVNDRAVGEPQVRPFRGRQAGTGSRRGPRGLTVYCRPSGSLAGGVRRQPREGGIATTEKATLRGEQDGLVARDARAGGSLLWSQFSVDLAVPKRLWIFSERWPQNQDALGRAQIEGHANLLAFSAFRMPRQRSEPRECIELLWPMRS